MKTIVSLVLGMLLAGCVRIGVERPVGTAATADDIQRYEGEWLNPDSEAGTISPGDSPDEVKVVEKKDSGDEVTRYTVTKIGDVLFAWVKPSDLEAYLPGRVVSNSSDYLVVLIPDEKEVKALAAAGKVKGTYLKDKDAWILSADGMEEILAGKEFWSLETALTLIRKPAPEAAPGATPQDPGQK